MNNYLEDYEESNECELGHIVESSEEAPFINFNYAAMRVLQEESLFSLIDSLKLKKGTKDILKKEISLLQKLAFQCGEI